MDWLLERQTRIENKLAKTHLKDGMLILFDVFPASSCRPRQDQEAKRQRFKLVQKTTCLQLTPNRMNLDACNIHAAFRPVRPTGNSGILGIPGSVSRSHSPTEI